MNLQDIFMDYLSCRNWAVDQQRLNTAMELVRQFVTTRSMDVSKLLEKNAADPQTARKSDLAYSQVGTTAIIPVTGLIVKYGRMVNGASLPKGASVEELSRALNNALADDSITQIVFQIESPGGSMAGLPDFADEVYQASFKKPIIAFADDLAASAAYWIGSQANAFYANQSAMVGSIGVYTVMTDMSGLMEKIGLKYHLIKSGENKGAGYPGTQITDSNLAAVQEMIDEDFNLFINHILRGRAEKGLDEKTLRDAADGRCYSAARAKKLSLIDGVMTLGQVLTKRPRTRQSTTRISAASAVDSHLVISNRKVPSMENPTPQTPLATADAAGTATLAAEQERSRILGIQSILAGSEFDTVRNKAIAEGWDVSRAKAEAFDVAQTARLAEQKAAGETQAAMQQRLDAIAKSGHAEELVPQADTTPDKPVAAIASGAGSADAFETSVKAHVNAGKTLAAAQSLAAKESPANHRAWILASQKR